MLGSYHDSPGRPARTRYLRGELAASSAAVAFEVPREHERSFSENVRGQLGSSACLNYWSARSHTGPGGPKRD